MSKPSLRSRTSFFVVVDFCLFIMEMHTYTEEIKKQMEYMNQINGLAPAEEVESLFKMKALDADPAF